MSPPRPKEGRLRRPAVKGKGVGLVRFDPVPPEVMERARAIMHEWATSGRADAYGAEYL